MIYRIIARVVFFVVTVLAVLCARTSGLLLDALAVENNYHAIEIPPDVNTLVTA